MYLVRIWNAEKIESLTGVIVRSHNDLLKLEDEKHQSYSSTFICDNPQQAINAVYNETDCDLQYYFVDVKDHKAY